MEEVLNFIEKFQSPSNLELFSEIACYWFARILSERFQDSCIYYNPDRVHFATKIEDRLYDITGAIPIEDSEYYYDFNEYEEMISQDEMYDLISIVLISEEIID